MLMLNVEVHVINLMEVLRVLLNFVKSSQFQAVEREDIMIFRSSRAYNFVVQYCC